MKTTLKTLIHASLAACGTTMLLAGSVHAADLRSWDQKIGDATKRFVVLAAFGNEAVLDKETQLVWQRYVSNVQTFHWSAWRACAALTVGGRMGWRLPTLAELTSLVEPAMTDGAKLPPGHPFLTLSKTPLPAWLTFWSSTFDRTSPQNPDSLVTYRYYVLDLDTAEIAATASPVEQNYICVRGTDPANAD